MWWIIGIIVVLVLVAEIRSHGKEFYKRLEYEKKCAEESSRIDAIRDMWKEHDEAMDYPQYADEERIKEIEKILFPEDEKDNK